MRGTWIYTPSNFKSVFLILHGYWICIFKSQPDAINFRNTNWCWNRYLICVHDMTDANKLYMNSTIELNKLFPGFDLLHMIFFIINKKKYVKSVVFSYFTFDWKIIFPILIFELNSQPSFELLVSIFDRMFDFKSWNNLTKHNNN